MLFALVHGSREGRSSTLQDLRQQATRECKETGSKMESMSTPRTAISTETAGLDAVAATAAARAAAAKAALPAAGISGLIYES